MGLMIGTGSLFGIGIDEEKKVGLDGIGIVRVILSAPDARIFAGEGGSEARFRLRGASFQRASLSVESKDGAVEVRVKRPWKAPALEKLTLDVFLPADYGRDLVVETSSGKVRAEPVRFAGLSVKTSSGGFQADGVSAEKASFRSSSGSVRIGILEAGSAALSASSGSIEIETCRASRIEARSSSGNIRLGSLEGNLFASATSGGIKVRYPEYRGYDATIKASSGSVLVELPADARFSLKARTAGGKVSSDFAAGESGPGTIEVSTSSGRVEIRKR